MMRFNKTIIVGSRKSSLAMKQSKIVIDKLSKLFPDCNFKIKGIVTSGDRLKILPKKQVKGMFVKEIEEALINGVIDFAVHSMKDLPVDIHDDLDIAAVTRRAKCNDVLISRNAKKLAELPKGSCVGTSSPRRKCQLLLIRPDLKVTGIKGNLDTRINKLDKGQYDAIIVAAAGVQRLGCLDRITEYLSVNKMLPAPAQGALGIQTRKNDKRIKSIVRKLNDVKTAIEVTAEREFLRAMGGGCRVPIGALAKVESDALTLDAIVFKNNGIFFRTSIKEGKKFPQKTGQKLAKRIKIFLGKQKTNARGK